MSVVVLGCGRSGTNLLLAALSASDLLTLNNPAEDKEMFRRDVKYGDTYLAKLDTHYFDKAALHKFMRTNPDVKVLWTIRDPRDICMSKLRRGTTVAKGGDPPDLVADDATPKGCLANMNKMLGLYQEITEHYSDRVLLVQMEDMILSTELCLKGICAWLDIPFVEEMMDFPGRMPIPYKRDRYDHIDKGEVAKWTNWENAYDGWLVKENVDMEKLFADIDHITRFFGYGS